MEDVLDLYHEGRRSTAVACLTRRPSDWWARDRPWGQPDRWNGPCDYDRQALMGPEAPLPCSVSHNTGEDHAAAAGLEKVRGDCGAYPDRALVLCVDEKSQIQALDVAPGRCGPHRGHTHDYVWCWTPRHLRGPKRGQDRQAPWSSTRHTGGAYTAVAAANMAEIGSSVLQQPVPLATVESALTRLVHEAPRRSIGPGTMSVTLRMDQDR